MQKIAVFCGASFGFSDGFFELLLVFVAHGAQQGFVKPAHADLLIQHHEAGSLIDLLDKRCPPRA